MKLGNINPSSDQKIRKVLEVILSHKVILCTIYKTLGQLIIAWDQFVKTRQFCPKETLRSGGFQRTIKPQKKRFWSYVWVLGSVSDPWELTDQFLDENNSVYARYGKTSYFPMQI